MTTVVSDNPFPKLIGVEQASTPATPDAGQRKLYPKADGWYDLDDAGVETGPLGAGGSGGGTGDAAWTVPTLGNSWINLGAGFQTARFRKDANGFVHVEGVIKSGTVGQAAFTLPAGYRPGATLLFPAVSNSVFGRLDILATGEVKPASGSTNSFTLTATFYAEA